MKIVDLVNNLGKDKKKIFLLIFLVILVSYADYNFMIKWQLSKLKRNKAKIIKLKLDLNNLARDLKKAEGFKNEQASAQKARTLSKKIISEGQISELLQDISHKANQNNVKILQLVPNKEAQAKQEKPPLVAKFSYYLIALSISCDYHHLGKFINDLENSETFMMVDTLKIQGQADYFTQKANLVMRVYVKK
jgi:Tfp pilus assembly protein PilO